MEYLELSAEEMLFVVLTIDVNTYWPPPDSPWSKLDLGSPGAGGPMDRLKWLRPLVADTPEPIQIAVTRSELWWLDTALLPHSRGKMPSGKLVLDLLEKVWTALVDSYKESVDANRNEDSQPAKDSTEREAVPRPG